MARATAATPISPCSMVSATSSTLPTRSHSGPGGGSLTTACLPTARAPFNLRPDQVLLLSGHNAMLSRQMLSNIRNNAKHNPDVLNRFRYVAFGNVGCMELAGKPANDKVRALINTNRLTDKYKLLGYQQGQYILTPPASVLAASKVSTTLSTERCSPSSGLPHRLLATGDHCAGSYRGGQFTAQLWVELQVK